ncbi:MAG: AAA family ATPase, partial [Parabacteroides sp.]|nr:AAA family ATPase [Parabacteroides sp.]
MKIANLQIQKFRSIDNATITIEQILAVVGANNAGKSHFLRALNAFFNYNDEKESFLSQDHVYSLRSRPKITVTFTDIQPEDQINPDYIYDDSLTIRFTYRWDRKTPSYDIIKAHHAQTISVDQFESLISHFRYIYVPIVRNYESAISGDGGIAYGLLKSIFQHQVANRNTIQPLVDRLTDKIKNTVFKSALNSIKQYYPLGNADFAIQAVNNEVVDLILRSVSLFLSENTQSNEINNCGSGIQSAVYFAISMAVAIEDNINYLVGIEEPELNMHPQAQRQLIETLKNPTKYPKTQFILTTHSTVIIDKLGHTSIVLCRKSKVPGRDVVTTATQILPNFWEKYSFSQERYYNFYQYKNSDFFFSNYIIITESPTDCNIIAALLSKCNIDIETRAISLIPADGEKSIKYPYALAKELGIPFICIVDRDVFLPYSENSRKESLGEDGIPQ